jgi:hypothetical protein
VNNYETPIKSGIPAFSETHLFTAKTGGRERGEQIARRNFRKPARRIEVFCSHAEAQSRKVLQKNSFLLSSRLCAFA